MAETLWIKRVSFIFVHYFLKFLNPEDLPDKHHTLNDLKIIDIPKVEDTRGNLAVVEKMLLGYSVKRVYYLYDVPSSALRGGHSHKEQHATLVALSGSFEVVLNDGKDEK